MGAVGPGSVDVAGFHIDYPNQSHAVFLVHEVFVNGEYLFHTTATRPRIVDCGANIGISVLFFKALYPAAEIVAFEPDPVAFECLTHTIESNQLQSVAVEQAAVTEHGGTVTLYRPRSDPGSLVASIDPAWGGSEGEPVRAVRLSDYITAPVDFLKIDIEGAEPGVVRDLVNGGAIKWIRETAIEYHHREPQADALERMAEALRAAGFEEDDWSGAGARRIARRLKSGTCSSMISATR